MPPKPRWLRFLAGAGLALRTWLAVRKSRLRTGSGAAGAPSEQRVVHGSGGLEMRVRVHGLLASLLLASALPAQEWVQETLEPGIVRDLQQRSNGDFVVTTDRRVEIYSGTAEARSALAYTSQGLPPQPHDAVLRADGSLIVAGANMRSGEPFTP